jgi:hypothetical protein
VTPFYFISLATTLVLAFMGGIWGITRWLATYMARLLDARMSAFEKHQEDCQSNLRRQEREFLEFKADLPKEYVRQLDLQIYREDRVRAEAVLDHKLDAVGVQVKEVWRKLYE